MLVEKYDEFRLSFVGSFTGLSDPYCEVSLGGQEHKTKVITNSLNPKWNSSVRVSTATVQYACYGYNFENTNRTFQMQFSLRDLKQDVLCISVFDQDMYSPNGALK